MISAAKKAMQEQAAAKAAAAQAEAAKAEQEKAVNCVRYREVFEKTVFAAQDPNNSNRERSRQNFQAQVLQETFGRDCDGQNNSIHR